MAGSTSKVVYTASSTSITLPLFTGGASKMRLGGAAGAIVAGAFFLAL